MPLHYLHYDVFTSEPLAGNQLAVYLDGHGIAPDRMQAIAREMHFSETTFVTAAEPPAIDVRMRIFTPGVELPMAGHPVIGTTFALADAGRIAPGTPRFVFGLGVGPTPVDLEWGGGRLRFAWMTQKNPAFGPFVDDRAGAAAALGLTEDDLAAELPVQEVSCGVPYMLIPLRDRATVDRAVSDAGAMRRFAERTPLDHAVYLFAVPAEAGAEVYSRMFAPQLGILEDAATGSACGPLGSYLVQHGVVRGDAASRIVSLQGVAMQRPSRIHIAIDGEPGAITRVRVGGEAVLIARGELLV